MNDKENLQNYLNKCVDERSLLLSEKIRITTSINRLSREIRECQKILNDNSAPQPKQEVCEHKNIRENISGGRFDECLDCGKIWG